MGASPGLLITLTILSEIEKFEIVVRPSKLSKKLKPLLLSAHLNQIRENIKRTTTEYLKLLLPEGYDDVIDAKSDEIMGLLTDSRIYSLRANAKYVESIHLKCLLWLEFDKLLNGKFLNQ